MQNKNVRNVSKKDSLSVQHACFFLPLLQSFHFVQECIAEDKFWFQCNFSISDIPMMKRMLAEQCVIFIRSAVEIAIFQCGNWAIPDVSCIFWTRIIPVWWSFTKNGKSYRIWHRREGRNWEWLRERRNSAVWGRPEGSRQRGECNDGRPAGGRRETPADTDRNCALIRALPAENDNSVKRHKLGLNYVRNQNVCFKLNFDLDRFQIRDCCDF